MAKAILGAFVTAIVIKLFIFSFIIAEGNSMEPTIRSGSVLVVNRLEYGLRLPGQRGYLLRWGSPREGDIVVFYTPNGGIAVKRITALLDTEKFMAQGDNTLLSYDSRSYGPISTDNAIGRVLGIRKMREM